MTDAAILEVEGLTKTFPGQRALDGVTLSVMAGEVHGLVGHNGSGKSTLAKVLSGFHEPDAGARVLFDGASLPLSNPRAALEAGLRFVHQHLALVDDLSVCENVALGPGFATGRLWRLRWREQRSRTREELLALGHDIDPRVAVGSLSPAERTIVALARALDGSRGTAKLLVLDEVTATLPAGEAERVFTAIRSITAQGVAVLYISHRLDEVLDVSGTVTVLRLGRRVGTFASCKLTRDSLARLMVGDIAAADGTLAVAPRPRPAGGEHGTGGLEVRGLCGAVITDLDLSVPRGFVLGITGLTGSGREELPGLLFGRVDRTGSVSVDGTMIPPHRPDRSIVAGIVLVPADRARDAIFASLDVRVNMTISGLAPFWRPPILNRRKELLHVKQWLDGLLMDPEVHSRLAGLLSGGMQQKTLLARALRLEPKVLILDEPTQGVDVQTKELVYERVLEAAAAGAAIVVSSSDSEDLCRVADEILVLALGRPSARISAEERPTPGRIDALQLVAPTGRGT
jgi:ribose transport system ATP-binding protein